MERKRNFRVDKWITFYLGRVAYKIDLILVDKSVDNCGDNVWIKSYPKVIHRLIHRVIHKISIPEFYNFEKDRWVLKLGE